MQILKKGFSIFAAVCLLLAVMPGQTVRADETTDENGFTVDDSGTLVASAEPVEQLQFQSRYLQLQVVYLHPIHPLQV